MRALAGLDDARIHDLRHSFASFAVGAGLSLPIIGGLLGHKNVQTTARYAHLAHDPLKQASGLVGTVITARKYMAFGFNLKILRIFRISNDAA